MNRNIYVITKIQFTILIFTFMIGDNVAILPSIQAIDAKQNGWIAGLCSTLVGVLLILFIYYPLSRLHPKHTIVQYSEKIMGKWMGKIITSLFVLYSFYYSSLTLRVIGDFSSSQILVNTPKIAIYILFAIVLIMGVRLGIETIARSSELFIYPIIFFIFFLMLSLLPSVDLKNLQPILDDGLKTTLRGSISFISLPFMELVFFLMISPYVKTEKKAWKPWLVGTILGGVFLISFVTMCTLVLGVNVTAEQIYPGLKLSKRVSLGLYLQKLELLISMVWFLAIFIRSVICFYCAYTGLIHLFRVKDSRPIIFPLGVTLIALTSIISVDISFNTSLNRLRPIIDFFCGFSPVFIMLIVGLWQKKRKKMADV